MTVWQGKWWIMDGVLRLESEGAHEVVVGGVGGGRGS